MLEKVRSHDKSDGSDIEPVFITNDAAMLELCYQIKKIAKTETTVLITGESGTGKEIVSHLIHHFSKRSNQAFIALNCGAIPRDIVESELFGHEKGAFTGAVDKKEGCFELATKGILFLDEIGEMKLDTQVKLLRVVENKSFRRIGGKKEIETDTRVIAATNKEMSEALAKGEFRRDLFYRLSVIELHIPPLRDRTGDILLLANYFLSRFIQKHNCGDKGFSEECKNILTDYHWPGNVRELRNTIERCVIMCPNESITPEYLPYDVTGVSGRIGRKSVIPGYNGHVNGNGNGQNHINIPVGVTMQEAERMLINKTLSSVNNNKSEAARILGFSRKTLHNKLNRYSNQ